jgi:hypothetical protein
VHDFVRRTAQRVTKDVQSVSAFSLTSLMRLLWPGSV